MKKIILSVALLAAVVMTSCGKTACSCKEEMMALNTEAMSNAGDLSKAAEYAQKATDLAEDCKGFSAEDMAKCN